MTQKAGEAPEFIPSEHVELVFTVFLLGTGLEYLSRHYFLNTRRAPSHTTRRGRDSDAFCFQSQTDTFSFVEGRNNQLHPGPQAVLAPGPHSGP